jgi:hypothetical protein
MTILSVGATIEVATPFPTADFAATEIDAALRHRGSEGAHTIRLCVADQPQTMGLQPKGFRITVNAGQARRKIVVTGADAAGAMYGALEVAEVVACRGIEAVGVHVQNPHMAMRGIKFNLPLDARTPTYTEPSDAAQVCIPEAWNMEFWRQTIDSLARKRYNYLSLWNLHPFPSLVEVPGYEDVALRDVWRSKRISRKERYSLTGHEYVTEDILSDVEVLREMTIADKIAFWRDVMAYGKSRNVETYIVTWNVFDYGVFGKHGITDHVDNETTRDYFRRSVKQLFVTYPDLAGIGLTTGENMERLSTAQKEEWAFATYGQGVLDAAEELPGRRITFLHRQHQAGADDVTQTFKPLIDHPNIEFLFSYKYAKAHVMSATTQPYHGQFVKDIQSADVKTIWTLRNDSNYIFRWGAAGFVREFVRNIPADVSRGYYYGSDGHVWGPNFLERDVDGLHPLEIDRHWYHWLLWGRLGYNPDLGDDRLQDILAQRFALDETSAAKLFQAWQDASMVYPTVTGFHWGALDFQWYIEGCQSMPGPAQTETGIHDVNRFIILDPHPHSGYQSIPDYVRMIAAGGTTTMRTPHEVANDLTALAARATAAADGLAPTDHAELARTLDDIRTMSALGSYYSHKIHGATDLAMFRQTAEPEYRTAAIEHLRDAALAWKCYVELALAHYRNPLWTNRVGMVDWKCNYIRLLDDVRTAGGDPAELGLPETIDARNEPIARSW